MSKRIALVTGAAKGIGKAIVDRLVSDGFFVVLIDVDSESGLACANAIGIESAAFTYCDISKEEDVTHLFHHIITEYKRLDVVVNNAGVIRDNMIWNMTTDEYDTVMSINLKGVWLMCREAARIFKEQNNGRIINITSRAWLGNRGQSNYSASKAGVVALTRVLALELGKYNVAVNAVAPGLIDTPLTQKLSEDILQKLIDAQPGKSMGKPEDVAHAVSFLASDKTNFITGQTLYVDGGKSIGAGV